LLEPQDGCQRDADGEPDPENGAVRWGTAETQRAAEMGEQFGKWQYRNARIGGVELVGGALNDDADNFSEAERDDGQIIPAQPQRRQTDNPTGGGGDDRSAEAAGDEQGITFGEHTAVIG